ncbi:MAG: cytochrome c oxidase cbb3-type subunit [Pseudomonadota bacterium]|jgi:cytochrome c oxidase cbb3-type subunit 3
MADMPNDFWSGWIVVITVVSLLALAWMVISVYFSKAPDPTAHEPGTEPVWDGNLKEGNRAPPLWWFWLIFSAMIFSVIYLMLYPGMGRFKGMLNWSQDSRLTGSYEAFDDTFAATRTQILAQSVAELQADAGLMATAENLFDRQCATCHGTDARGQASLFPNLMDVDWQWGGSAEQIEQTIRNGRMAMMPAWGAALGEDGIRAMAEYVDDLGTDNAADHPVAATQFSQMCSACHGADGSGNPLLGAPRLNDDVWLYGNDLGDIMVSLRDGRNGVMPAFGERLDDVQIKLLVAFLAR